PIAAEAPNGRCRRERPPRGPLTGRFPCGNPLSTAKPSRPRRLRAADPREHELRTGGTMSRPTAGLPAEADAYGPRESPPGGPRSGELVRGGESRDPPVRTAAIGPPVSATSKAPEFGWRNPA